MTSQQTDQRNRTEQVETVVIGAGQAGLATAYHLSRLGRSCVVLDSHQRVGDVWRERYDSLRLFTPARYDSLPGLAMSLDGWDCPTKDQMADYLEEYALHTGAQVRTDVRVERLTREPSGYRVRTSAGDLASANVVVAAGTWRTPRVPAIAADLDDGIRQFHSDDYRNPGQLQDGPVLVVGAAHSGADIALEVAATHPTVLSGPIRGEVPVDPDGGRAKAVLPVLWFVANHVLTERTPMGRKARAHVRSAGGPLIRVKRRHLTDAGVELVAAKTTGTDSGWPLLEGGRVLDGIRNVIWCTGYRPAHAWIDLPVTDSDGWVVQSRGVVPDHPGLYFVGLPFQWAFASMLVGGVDTDAEYVARHLDGHRPRAGSELMEAGTERRG